jgi:hypothetical protein
VMIESELVSRQTPVVRSKWSSPLSHSTQEMSRPSATTQSSSAYIFHQYGTDVTEQTLPFIFNGNKLSSISVQFG